MLKINSETVCAAMAYDWEVMHDILGDVREGTLDYSVFNECRKRLCDKLSGMSELLGYAEDSAEVDEVLDDIRTLVWLAWEIA